MMGKNEDSVLRMTVDRKLLSQTAESVRTRLQVIPVGTSLMDVSAECWDRRSPYPPDLKTVVPSTALKMIRGLSGSPLHSRTRIWPPLHLILYLVFGFA